MQEAAAWTPHTHTHTHYKIRTECFSWCSSLIRNVWILLLTGLTDSCSSHTTVKRGALSAAISVFLSLQSANCALIVLHKKKTVKFITAFSHWLFWYWLKGLIKSAERGTPGQIAASEVIREAVTHDDLRRQSLNNILRWRKIRKCILVLNHFLL